MPERETVDECARRIVTQEVHCCVSTLVSTLCQGLSTAEGGLGELAEQACELSAPVLDFEEAVSQAGWVCKNFATRGEPVLKWWHPEKDDGSRYVPKCLEHICEDYGIEPYEREIFEHWAVSGWLADKLEARGERVERDFAGLIVWARTTTGQALYCDGVLQDIAREVLA